MPTVYLPMGYPIQQGLEFGLIVYQGNLVRSYSMPKDPRSDSQLFQRKFLSDVSKMRSYLGVWGKTAMREALGEKWASVLFQLIKTDAFSWWSDAIAEWEGFEEENQQAWRDAAPYQVTYNDQGKVLFCLVRVMVKTIRHYLLPRWRTEEWGETESAAALAWFTADYQWALVENGAGYTSELINLFGTWVETLWHWNGTQEQIESSGSADDWIEAYCYSKNIYSGVRTDPDAGIAQVYISGLFHAEVETNQMNSNTGVLAFYSTKKRLRSVLIRGKNGAKIAFISVGI